jgi:hypothetical protein
MRPVAEGFDAFDLDIASLGQKDNLMLLLLRRQP